MSDILISLHILIPNGWIIFNPVVKEISVSIYILNSKNTKLKSKMCGRKGDTDDNGADNDNIKLQENLPIGMTIMDFDTLTPSR